MSSDRLGAVGAPAARPRARASAPPGYRADLERDVLGTDGAKFHLRPIRPDDDRRLVEAHGHLSQETTYRRFFSMHATLSPAEVERFTCVDYVDRLALIAILGERLIAVGRYDRRLGTDEAEVAFVVADEFQHHGIGSVLLDELARAARASGITTFVAEAMAENRTMLGVFLHAGFAVTTTMSQGIVSVRFPIAMTDDYAAALAARERTRALRPEGDEGAPC